MGLFVQAFCPIDFSFTASILVLKSKIEVLKKNLGTSFAY